jgi:ligand-binding SRPBCC domain-containing protein
MYEVDSCMMHTLMTSMRLPLARDQVFAIFAEATNLARITPPELGFEMVTPPPIRLSAGTYIEYRLHLFGIPFSWHSEIQLFRYRQRAIRAYFAEDTHQH